MSPGPRRQATQAFCRSNRAQLLCCDFANWQLPPPVPWAFAKCQSGAVHQFKCEINRNESRSQSLAFCYNFRAICYRLCPSVRSSVCPFDRQSNECLSEFFPNDRKRKRSYAESIYNYAKIDWNRFRIDWLLVCTSLAVLFAQWWEYRRLCERG